MKKLLSLITMLAFVVSFGFAQVPARTTSTHEARHSKTPTETSTAPHMKKDGTPDKRYKDNKTTKAKMGPLKKDGTADMRYKSNKTVKPRS